jgi:chromosome segregation ATPase
MANDGDEGELESFATTEQLFASLVHSLFTDQSLDNFRAQYEQLHSALVQSRECNLALTERCRQLGSDITSSARKIASVISLGQGDARVIANLRTEFTRAWNLIARAQDRENKLQEVIYTLTIGAKQLRQMIAQSQRTLGNPQEVSKQLLEGSLMSLANDIKLYGKQAHQLTIELNETAQKVELAQKSIGRLNEEMRSLTDQSEKLTQTLEDLRREQIELTGHSNDTRNSISDIRHGAEDMEALFTKRYEEVHRKEKESRHLLQELSVWQEELARRRHRHDKMDRKLSQKVAANNALWAQICHVNTNFMAARAQISELNDQLEGLNSQVIESEKEYHNLVKTRKEMNKKRRKLFFTAKDLQKTELLTQTKISGSNFARRIGRLEVEFKTRADRVATQKLEDEERATQEVMTNWSLIQHCISRLKEIRHFQGERFQQMTEEIRKCQVGLVWSRSTIAEIAESSLHTQMELERCNAILFQSNEAVHSHTAICEALRVERDSLARAAAKQSQENRVLGDEVTSLAHQILAMKESIRISDKDCLEVDLARKQILENLKQVTKEITQFESNLKRRLEENEELRGNIKFMVRLSEQAEIENRHQRSIVVQYTDSYKYISKQLRKQQREADLVREKQRVFVSIIRIRNSQFQTLKERLTILEEDHQEQTEKEKELLAKLKHVQTTGVQCLKLQKDLLETQSRVNTLEEEARTPRNIHRWTLLKSTNPVQFALIALKLTLVNAFDCRFQRCEKLRRTELNLEKQLEHLDVRMRASHRSVFQEDLIQVSRLLDEKTTLLNEMESQLGAQKARVDSQHQQVDSVRSRIRDKKMETFDGRRKCEELRQAIHSPESESRVRPPAFSLAQRAPGRFKGGSGFGVEMTDDEGTLLNLAALERKAAKTRPVTSRVKPIFMLNSSGRASHRKGVAGSTRVYRE